MEQDERGVALPDSLSESEREAFDRLSSAQLLLVLPVQCGGQPRHAICEPKNVDGNESIVPLALLIDRARIRTIDFGDLSDFVGG